MSSDEIKPVSAKTIRYRTGIFQDFMIIPTANYVVDVSDDDEFNYKFVFNNPTKKLYILQRFYRKRNSDDPFKVPPQSYRREWEFLKNITVHYFEKD